MAAEPADPVAARPQESYDELRSQLDELRARQREILESEARFRILSELISDCCWARWTPAHGGEERVWVNDAFSTLTGYSPQEFEAIGRKGLLHPDDLPKVLDYVDGPEGTSELEFRILRKDGTVRWLHERMFVRDDARGRLVLGATRDVTAERRAAEALKNIHRELEEQVAQRTSELAAEIQERRRVEAELRRAKELAEAGSRAKSEFLANISHELRTPVNGILGLSQMLLREELPRRAAGCADLLHSTAQTLHQLIREVLDFSKVEAGQVSLEDRNFKVRDLESTLASLLWERARSQGTHLFLRLSSNLPAQLRGDDGRLRQILSNLIENALKFTHQGTVEVRAWAPEAIPTGDRVRVRFEVRDNGVGIPEALQGRLFEPFVQGPGGAGFADASGTGLGLSICKRLVEHMGGEIELESKEGSGTVVRFSVLLALADPELSAAAEDDLALPAAGERPWRVLLAEDHPVNRLVLRHQLERLGLAVVEVEDGNAAVVAADREAFDLILMDCRMPVLDGYEATRAIRRSEPPNRHVPIIAVTANAIREQIEVCYEAGMDDVLPKPFNEEELATTLRRWLPADQTQ